MHEFRADLHIHSRFSRATSTKLSFGLLAAWSKVKGIDVLGTGDFTHPSWREEMREQLAFDEASGLYVMKRPVGTETALPGLAMETPEPRFMIQGEISSIYKRGGQVRKVHNLVFMPDLETTEKFCKRLEQVGNLGSDGRPILGLDSRDLLEMVLEAHEKAFVIPAHIWTPWFSVFGSKSGFNDIRDCFGDLTSHIFALETGLSSDPAMNRLWSSLDAFRLVSNSDAHSGENLGREVNLFSGEISYDGMLSALRHPEQPCGTRFNGTLEFFPEEGKYHTDGHRKCNVHLTPAQTREIGGICPVCGQPLTVGVLYRVMELADRDQPVYPDDTTAHTVVPLPEVLGELLGVGPKTRKVNDMYVKVLERFGSELHILNTVPEADLAGFFPPLGEAVGRMRRGEVHITSGFDGEYGVIRMFTDEERRDIVRGASGSGKSGVRGLSLLGGELPEASGKSRQRGKPVEQPQLRQTHDQLDQNKALPAQGGRDASSLSSSTASAPQDPTLSQSDGKAESAPESMLEQGLNEEQERASMAGPGPVLVLAGPGTGKTRTLVSRAAWLLEEGLSPRRILAVTFTRKAATEMDQRLAERMPGSPLPRTDTLHALALDLWHKTNADVPVLLSEESARRVFAEANPEVDAQTLKTAWSSVNLAREKLCPMPDECAALASNYSAHKSAWNLADYTDLLEFWLERTASGLDKGKWDHVLVDEIQDLSPLQLSLVRSLLPSGGEGFFGIGDPDQSIYGFRGASGQSLEFFREAWPGLEVITLTRNYRSRPEIIQAAVALQDGHSSAEGLEAVSEDKGYIHLFHAPTADAEARWIADRVGYLLGSTSHTLLDADMSQGGATPALQRGTYAPGDIAILVRTHALGHPIRKALARVGLPVAEPQADAFWEDPRVALILRSVGRLYGIALASEEGEEEVPDCPDKVLAKGPLGLAAYFSTVPPFDELFWHTKAFRGFVKAYDATGGWAELITWINLQNELELVRSKAQKVQVLSLHAAKGLEFPVVFMPCLEDGILPFAGPGLLSGRMDKNSATDVEEERRLLYVGATRAREALFLSWAEKRTLFGKELRLKPSRFLQALPKELATASALVAKSSLSEKQLTLLG